MSSNSSKVVKRYSNRPQCPQKFINVLNSSVGNQVRKDPQCPEKSLNSSKGSGPQKFHKKSSKGPENSSMLWDPQVRRSSKSPQKVHKVHSGKCTKGRPQRSSNVPQITQKVPNVLEVLIGPQKVFKATSNTSTNLSTSSIPQRPQVLNRFKRSKKSSKVPERFFNVLRASGPQVFKKSSKGPQSPQKVKKMHKRYPRSSGLRFSTDPQNVLKFLKRSSKPSKSSEVHKRYSRRPQFLKKLSTSSKSCGRQKFLKWSSNGPHKVLKSS